MESRQVQFSPGPFMEQYEDGHPPEKETEEERRRYRCGLMLRGSVPFNGECLEEAFHVWLKRYEDIENTDALDVPTAEVTISNLGVIETKISIVERKHVDLTPFAPESIAIEIPSNVTRTRQIQEGVDIKEDELSEKEEDVVISPSSGSVHV